MTRIIAVTLVALVAATIAGTARAGATYVYIDPPGDNKSAPDVQKITLTDGGDGTVAVEIDLAAEIPPGDSFVYFGIDADRNRDTGNRGDEYAVILRSDSGVFAKWDGGGLVPADHHAIAPNMVGGRVTFTLTLADIGADEFDFWVLTSAGADDFDTAPTDGVFSYPQTVAKPSIQSVLLGARAILPRGGRTFALGSVQVKLSTSEIVTADSLTCSLTRKGEPLAPVGTCAWKIPESLKRQVLVLTVTAGYQGAEGRITLPLVPR
ncbi:MAG TPA: hypothetical protein VGK79_07310 [Gaiellaceae bacterium]